LRKAKNVDACCVAVAITFNSSSPYEFDAESYTSNVELNVLLSVISRVSRVVYKTFRSTDIQKIVNDHIVENLEVLDSQMLVDFMRRFIQLVIWSIGNDNLKTFVLLVGSA
jgi:hypothetical protein